MTQMTIQQAMDLARQYHQARRLAEAESIYRQILSAQPDQPDALHQLGVLQFQSGRLAEAVTSISRAIELQPTSARFHCNLGAVLLAHGQPAKAIESHRRALELRPDFADAFFNLGNALRALGRGDEAIAAYRQAIVASPNSAESWLNLANVLRELKQMPESIEAYQKSLELRPGVAEVHHNLGNVLANVGRLDEAIAQYHLALKLRPELTETLNALAMALRRAGRPEESRETARQAITAKPDFAHAHNSLGNALYDLGEFDDAIAAYRQAIALQPDFALAHSNLSLSLLLIGQYANGWEEHEWRLRAPELGRMAQDFPQPRWDGGDLSGKTILLHAEQAFGDAIQFARFAKQAKARGGRVILQCHRELHRLFRSFKDADVLLSRGEPLPEFDVHCPLMSLPRALGLTPETIPAEVPYLAADELAVGRWRDRLPEGSRRIGLVWAGRRQYLNDRNRSMSLSLLAPLHGVQDARFVSLQKGDIPADVQESPEGLKLTDWTSELEDFADTAALIENLDLVIAVDTAVAHLAGALGRPVWLLLPFVPDWRWMLNRTDSPWYPTMRLFRQPRIGDWQIPVQQIVQELRCLK